MAAAGSRGALTKPAAPEPEGRGPCAIVAVGVTAARIARVAALRQNAFIRTSVRLTSMSFEPVDQPRFTDEQLTRGSMAVGELAAAIPRRPRAPFLYSVIVALFLWSDVVYDR